MAGRTYKSRHGLDWPADMADEFIDMTVAKKWRMIESEVGVRVKDPWVPLIGAATRLLPDEYFRVSEWTEQHFHDFVMHDKLVTWGCASSGKSNDTALLLLLDWAVDPYDTVTLLGSTTKEDLRSRSWEAVVRYHNALCRNPLGLAFPGRIRKQGQSLVNVEEDDAVESSGEKAGIQGRALNEDGRLQGAHAKHVRLVVDELAEIANHEAVKVAMANLRVGTLSFKFIGLANPGSWENPSCQYCLPEGGPSAVTPDTGSWTSTFGCFVRHHDGLRSPCVLDPSKRARFPFLLSSGEVEAILREAGGNADAPQFWKMVRGFPAPAGAALPTVLDPRVARRERVGEPNASPDPVVRTVAGIDPAWTQGGDGAFRARAHVRRDPAGRFYLDFTDGLDRLHILASDPRPPVQQMRDQVVQLMRRPGEASFHDTAVDSSANQGLGDDLLVYAGADCLQVNSAVRAGDAPLRGAGDLRPARETVHDRGTEAWCVLAEFCKAGQVRGLPPRALEALVTRRFAMRTARDAGGRRVPTGPAWPLRLEDKAEFRKRFKGSPDECDACALAALAAKERAGLAPYGFLEGAPSPFSLVPRAAPAAPAVSVPDSAGLDNDPDGGAPGGFSIDPCDVF